MKYQIAEPLNLWSEIIPNLWVGGTQDSDVVNLPKKLPNFGEESLFDTVVSLYAFSQPVGWQVKELRYGFSDGPLTQSDNSELNRIADWACQDFRSGKRVGIRCQLGINRSCFLAGKILLRLGYAPIDAIKIIREKRSGYALSNKYFEESLMAE